MMAQQIPGVPDGWELVRFGVPTECDHWLDRDGEISSRPTRYSQLIIRKIEKPAKYRPFASAEEHLPHWGKPIRLKGGVGFDSVVSTSRIGIYVASETLISRHTMVGAFEKLEFADGTPFGVKIDE